MQDEPKCFCHFVELCGNKSMQKEIAHWDKQNNGVPAPNCMLKV